MNKKGKEPGEYIGIEGVTLDYQDNLLIYDKSWNLIRRNICRDNTTNFAMINFDNLAKHNGAYYFKQTFGDTIYNVTQKADILYIVLDKGKYKMPVEIAASLDKLNKKGARYIQRDSYRLASNYMFLTYYYDIWDFEKEQLIYRGILDYKARKRIKGIPLEPI